MENLDIYSLIPLILILVLPWLLSSLGARLRGRAKAEDGSTSSTSSTESQILDFLTMGKPDGAPTDAEPIGNGPQGTGPSTGERWNRIRQVGAPKLTSKPITPKWWGA